MNAQIKHRRQHKPSIGLLLEFNKITFAGGTRATPGRGGGQWFFPIGTRTIPEPRSPDKAQNAMMREIGHSPSVRWPLSIVIVKSEMYTLSLEIM